MIFKGCSKNFNIFKGFSKNLTLIEAIIGGNNLSMTTKTTKIVKHSIKDCKLSENSEEYYIHNALQRLLQKNLMRMRMQMLMLMLTDADAGGMTLALLH